MNNFWLTFIIAMYSILVFVYPIFRAAGDCVIRDLAQKFSDLKILKNKFEWRQKKSGGTYFIIWAYLFQLLFITIVQQKK